MINRVEPSFTHRVPEYLNGMVPCGVEIRTRGLIVTEVFFYGFLTSLRYTSMNAPVYAGCDRRTGERRELYRAHDAADGD